jgi:hypothetical protein
MKQWYVFLALILLSGCGLITSSVSNLEVPSLDQNDNKVTLTLPPLVLVEGGTLLVVLKTSSELELTSNLSWTITGTDAATTFTANSGTVSFAGQVGSFTIVSIDDALVNGSRNFTLQMALAGSSLTLANSTFSIQVTDNDVRPTITLAALPIVASTNVTSYTMSGTCSANAQDVVVAIKDGVHTVNPSPQPTCLAGVWSLASLDLSALDEGNLSVTIDHADGAGNTAVQIVRALFKDTIPPSVPSLVIDGASKASLTDSPVVTFTGALQADLDHYEIQVKNLNTSAVVKTWATFASGAVVSGLSLTSEASYFVEVRSVDTYGNISGVGYSDGWMADTFGPTAPTGLAITYQSLKLNSTGPLAIATYGTDAGVGVQKTQVRLVTAADVLVKDWVDNALNTSYQENTWNGFASLTLTSSAGYKVQARSLDNLGNVGAVAELAFTAKTCPVNYVPVYPLATRPAGNFPTYPYPTTSVCVAKFEMKATDGAGTLSNTGNGNVAYSATYHAASRPDGTPWIKMNQIRAVNRCTDIGQALITNGQWQTMARHIASTASNWSTGTALSGYLNIGNYTDGVSATAVADGLAFGTMKTLAASSATVIFSDASPYVGIRASPIFAGKRTHVFPWGDVIWDLGGNAIETMRDIVPANQWITLPAEAPIADLTGSLVDLFGFTGSITSCVDIDNVVDNWDQIGNKCTAGVAILPTASDAWDLSINRGSHYTNGADNGIFKVDTMDGTSDTLSYGGFRCVIENP